MNSQYARRISFGALLAAMICLATSILKIPVAHGYVHPGDIFIFLAALTLGPAAGISAAIGSALADMLGGYAMYALPTFFIKGAIGYAAGRLLYSGVKKHGIVKCALVLSACGLFMSLGYWITDMALFGMVTATAGLPMNLLQGLFGVVGGMLLSRLSLPVIARS